jgi:aspartyl-tRNA(Asn)/glutamyl-tRNA(Gln) amidotransferase subunit A
VIPLASSLDHPGPMARTIADCAALLHAMANPGAQHLPVMPPPERLPELPLTPRPGPRPFEGMTIALTDRPDGTPMESRVAIGFEECIRCCERLGARVIEFAAPWAFEWDDLSLILMTEVWAYHRHHAELHELYRPAIAEFVEVARNFVKAPPYLDAQQRRAQGTAAWEQWFTDNRVDLVLEPTLPIVPYERGPGYDRGHAGGPGDPMIALTALWDMTGMPVASLPVSWEIGVSLIAPRGHEAPLVQAAIDLQESRLGVPDWP